MKKENQTKSDEKQAKSDSQQIKENVRIYQNTKVGTTVTEARAQKSGIFNETFWPD